MNTAVAVAVAVTELFVTSRKAKFAIHCFGTMLKVEVLEKRLDLGLARSRSRSRLVAKIRRLGLVSVSWNCTKVLVSVSSRTKNQMSRFRLGPTVMRREDGTRSVTIGRSTTYLVCSIRCGPIITI